MHTILFENTKVFNIKLPVCQTSGPPWSWKVVAAIGWGASFGSFRIADL